ncbi:LAFE_0F06194g1_1 [Lachancea fermentati]|uniref:LAFE_0F06194g1_1 n=1 Tax=Lachancea fermentati TaxID=4955 RepID=A0A1G4MEY5_LACFM|nr:LAFE_0F06194g1_1 [Lachancea fermentati]
METGQPTEITEQQRAQLQFQLFQESLPKVSTSVFRMLLNEMVPLSVAVEDKVGENPGGQHETSSKNDLEEAIASNLSLKPCIDPPSHKLIAEYAVADEDKRLRIKARLNSMGLQIGKKLSELLIFSNNPNLNFKDMDLLTVMKFICRDVWRQMFGKQIDNLKTNHRGTFYLFDYDYRPIQCLALDGDVSDLELNMIDPYLEIPCGIIKGVLLSLGFDAKDQVSCEATVVDLPDTKTGELGSFPKGISFNVQVLLQ